MKKFFSFGIALMFVFALSVNIEAKQCYSLSKMPDKNYFTLVIDRSGSMQGRAMNDAKQAAKKFVSMTGANDYVSVVAFSDSVEVVTDFTSDKNSLYSSIDSIQPYGMTALYDAVARSVSMLRYVKGKKIVLYLTDGYDNKSSYTMNNIASMNLNTGVFVYGIGLGDVDENVLNSLSLATRGKYAKTFNSADLSGIYVDMLNSYKSMYSSNADYASLSILSIPEYRKVNIQGKQIGNTPLKFDEVPAGRYTAEIIYDAGVHKCDFEIKAGYLTLVESREADLGTNLYFAARPTGSAVFIDEGYVGTTHMTDPVTEANFASKAKNGKHLFVKRVPFGQHKIQVKGLPGEDFGPEQVIEFDFNTDKSELILFVDVLHRKIVDNYGRVYGASKVDPFDQLGNEE